MEYICNEDIGGGQTANISEAFYLVMNPTTKSGGQLLQETQ
jgi:hypothetical protein